MATRVYLPRNAQPGIHTPAFSNFWGSTTGAGRLRAFRDQDYGSYTFGTLAGAAETSAVAGNALHTQWHLPNLATQTITGDVKGQILALESNADADGCLQLHLRVVSPTGTERGTLFASQNTSVAVSASAGTDNYELPTSITNRKLPPGWSGSGSAMSSVDATEGDMLVIEVGWRYHNVTTSSRTMTLRSGFLYGNDLAEDETATADAAAWIEVSNTLTFVDSISLKESLPLLLPREPTRNDGGAPIPSEGQTWPRGAGSW